MIYKILNYKIGLTRNRRGLKKGWVYKLTLLKYLPNRKVGTEVLNISEVYIGKRKLKTFNRNEKEIILWQNQQR